MATSSMSSHHVNMQNTSGSGSEELGGAEQIMDIRKRKRMLSNRESARRSRQRKQKQLDDLSAHMSQLRGQNGQIVASVNVTTQLYMNIEAENSILRAQLAELSNRLQSLNDIIQFCVSPPAVTASVTATTTTTTTTASESDDLESLGSFDLDFEDVMNPWGISFASLPIMPAPDAFMC